MIFKPNNPGCNKSNDCHCGADCANCAGEVPEELEITLAGIDGAATFCTAGRDQLNDTYILTRDALAGNGCTWRYEYPGSIPCDGPFVGSIGVTALVATLYFDAGDRHYHLDVFIDETDAQGMATFNKDFGEEKPACDQWTDVNVPNDTESPGSCDGRSATCIVSAA
jgi:hypothetical protein